MPDEPSDNPTPDSDASTDAPTLAERKAFTPSGETKGGDSKPTKKGKKPKPEPTTFLGKLWYGWIKPIGSVIIVVVVVRSMLIDWNDVPSGSMEPEIHVGDRIAVNRLAYALQFPLTGPKIGIPFIGPQFDNPLDGIGQIQWAEPQRGDIVTFWNPLPPTHTRMVKRIVAVPGDTISIQGGEMTINGTAASYTDLDPLTAGLPPQTKWFEASPLGGKTTVRKDLEYREETLLDQTRIVQHIKERWSKDAIILREANASGMRYLIVDEGWLVENYQRKMKFDDYLARNANTPNNSYSQLATVKDGFIYIDGKIATHNELAELLLQPYAVEPMLTSLSEIDLEINKHELLVDGKPVPYAVFTKAIEARRVTLDKIQVIHVDRLRATLAVLQHTMMTNFGPYTIPEGKYFMVGDNRNNSSDSRFFGPVDRGEITGKAFAVAFSFEDNKMLTLPPDPAWDRFFKDLD